MSCPLESYSLIRPSRAPEIQTRSPLASTSLGNGSSPLGSAGPPANGVIEPTLVQPAVARSHQAPLKLPSSPKKVTRAEVSELPQSATMSVGETVVIGPHAGGGPSMFTRPPNVCLISMP